MNNIEKIKQKIKNEVYSFDYIGAEESEKILNERGYNNFYLRIATLGQRSLKEFREWALEKLDRDYNKKTAFDFAKEKVKNNHNTLVSLFNMRKSA